MLRNEHHETKIVVRFSSLLYDSLPEGHDVAWVQKYDRPYPDKSSLREISKNLNECAIREGAGFLQFAHEVAGIQSSEQDIILYVCPWVKGSISEPGIINPSRNGNMLKVTLFHEVLHRIFTRNMAYCIDQPRDVSLRKIWALQWGADLSFTTLIHIPVFALLAQYLSQTSEGEILLQEDRKRHALHPEYAAAWRFVDERGSLTICEELKLCMGQL